MRNLLELVEEYFGGVSLYEVIGVRACVLACPASPVFSIFGGGANARPARAQATKEADEAAIKRAYYRVALRFHPDKAKEEDKEAASQVARVSLF